MTAISRRSFLAVLAGAATSVGLTACSPWGRRNDKPSEEGLQALESLDDAIRKLPGVVSVETRFTTKAMQRHVISSVVELQAALPTADLVAFGTGAHAAVIANQVEPYRTIVQARTTTQDLLWSIEAGSDPASMEAAVAAALSEVAHGAHAATISGPVSELTGQVLRSAWGKVDEDGLLAATPRGIRQVERRLDAGVPEGTAWVNVVMYEGQPAATLPYEQALANLTPVLESSTTTLDTNQLRWAIKFDHHPVDDPALTDAAVAFLRTLREARVRVNEIELGFPWEVMLTIDGKIEMLEWLDGTSDRAAAEPVVAKVVASANQG